MAVLSAAIDSVVTSGIDSSVVLDGKVLESSVMKILFVELYVVVVSSVVIISSFEVDSAVIELSVVIIASLKVDTVVKVYASVSETVVI